MTEPTEPQVPPPPTTGSGGRIRRFWRARSWKGKTGIIVGSVLVLLILIGALAPPPEEENDAAAPATQPATTTAREPDPTTEAEVTTEPEAEEPAVAADTGRMSEGEYATFQRSLAKIDAEAAEYGNKLPKCSVLLRALQLADASECIGDAYSGLGNSMLAAFSTTEGLEGDVENQCLKALRLYKQRLDMFYGYMEKTEEAGENLQFEQFNALTSQTGMQVRRYRQARDWVLTDCEPR